MPEATNRQAVVCGLVVWLVGGAIALNYLRQGWTVDADGLSVMTGRLPYWDFTNLWIGGRLALEGHVADLFDVERYRAAMRGLLSPRMPDQEWSYPPSMLLIGVPLAMFSVLPAYLLWTGATLALLLLAGRGLGLTRWQLFFLLTAPATLLNLLFGQNGALTASLLLGGLLLSPKRPVIGGILLGLLTVKPHLGLLVPFCLLASGNYRAILSATATGSAVIVLTGCLFGWESWMLFLTQTSPMMRAIMEAPYPQGYQMNAMTFFVLARSFGWGLEAAYAFQATFALASIVGVIWLWRKRGDADHETRVAITGLLTLCATPYGYTYDAIPVAVAILVLGPRQLAPLLLLAFGWTYPLMNHIVAASYPSLGVLAPAMIAAAALIAVATRKRKTAEPRPSEGLKAS